MGNKGKSLTPKQERFCLEYVKDLNGTQAAIRSGYSEKTANSISTENLSKPYILERVQELKKGAASRSRMTTDDIIKGLSDIAEATDEKSADRIKAYEVVGKLIGSFEEHNRQKKPDLKATIKFTK